MDNDPHDNNETEEQKLLREIFGADAVLSPAEQKRERKLWQERMKKAQWRDAMRKKKETQKEEHQEKTTKPLSKEDFQKEFEAALKDLKVEPPQRRATEKNHHFDSSMFEDDDVCDL